LPGDLSAFAAMRDWLALATVLPVGKLFGAVHALTPGTALFARRSHMDYQRASSAIAMSQLGHSRHGSGGRKSTFIRFSPIAS